ncbi:MAG: hypothetical protein JWO22_1802 [Frankiales bacterium]|nr:hypothetical protein [Frankiales bacterium]
MHEHPDPYELVQPPQHVSLDGAVQALLLARWRDQSMVLVDGQVSWVRAEDVVVDWAPWSTAIASNV